MDAKNRSKTSTPKPTTVENGVIKKKISKAMRAAEKYRGSVEILDMEALFKPVF